MKRYIVAVALLLILSAFYASAMRRTIQQDEAYTLRHYGVSPAHALLSYTAPNNHLLHSLFLWLSTTLIGDSLIGVRLPAFGFGLLSLAMGYRVGRRLHGHPCGLLTLALIGSNLAFAGYTVNARGYTLSLFLALALMDVLIVGIPRITRRYRFAVMGLCFALVLTLPTMGIFIVGAGLWALLVARRSHRRRYWALLPAMLVGSASAGLFYAAGIFRGLLDEYVQTFGASDGESSLVSLARNWSRLVFSTPGVDLIFLVGLIIGIFVLVRTQSRHRIGLWYLCIAAITVALAVVQVTATQRLFYDRNYFYLLGPLALLAAVGLTSLPLSSALPAVIVVLFAVSARTLGVATEIDQFLNRFYANVQPGDAVIMGCCLAEPAYYHIERDGLGRNLSIGPSTTRVLIAEAGLDTFDALLDAYRLRDLLTGCEPVSDGSWAPFSVYACSLSTVRE